MYSYANDALHLYIYICRLLLCVRSPRNLTGFEYRRVSSYGRCARALADRPPGFITESPSPLSNSARPIPTDTSLRVRVEDSTIVSIYSHWILCTHRRPSRWRCRTIVSIYSPARLLPTEPGADSSTSSASRPAGHSSAARRRSSEDLSSSATDSIWARTSRWTGC